MYKKSFLSGSLLSMIEQGFSSVTSFLTTIIIAHSCSMQTAGQYALILSLSLIVLGLQRVIIAVPFSVHYPKYAEGSEKKRYYASTFSLEFIFLIAAGIISLFLGGKASHSANGIAFFIFFVGYLYKDFSRQLFFGVGRIGNCLIMSITQCVAQLGMLIFFRSNLSLNTVLGIIGGSCLVCSSPPIFLPSFQDIFQIQGHLKNRRNKETAKWSIGISMSDSVKSQMSVWMLNFFQSTESVAIYNNNNTLATLPQPVFVGLSQYLLPNLSASIQTESSKSVSKKVYSACLIAAVANLLWCIGLGILGKSLIGMLYGESYYIGVAPLLICCIRGIFVSLNNIQNAVLQAYGKPQMIFYTLLLGLLFLATAGAAMIWKGGIMGVCIAMLIVYIIPTTLQAYEIWKICNENN